MLHQFMYMLQYTGPYANFDKCPNCGILHLNESGRARRTFSYMPLITCLRALISNCTYATHLQYRANEHAKTRRPETITDIFGGLHYRSPLGEHVVVGDRTYPHNYFSDNCDITLGFATDGFTPFKSGSIPRGSFLFSTTISLQSNASERTFVLGSYLVQKAIKCRLLYLSTHVWTARARDQRVCIWCATKKVQALNGLV